MSKIKELRNVHFIGVGGISMSALCKLMLLMGKKVTGSDIHYSEEMSVLNQWGVEIWVGHDEKRLDKAELVVYTAAVPENDPELTYARQNGIPTVLRHHFLGELSKEFEFVIAVSGTHGKTTATGMITSIFKEAEEPFTAHIGGNLIKLGNLLYLGHKCLITEACEYKKSLLTLKPDVAVILNVEIDHPDTYSGINELYSTFNEFISNVKPDGYVVMSSETDFFDAPHPKKNILGFGLEGAISFKIYDINEYKNGYYNFKIRAFDKEITELNLAVPGFHNIYNAAAAFAASSAYGLKADIIKKGIESFIGVERRFEEKGKCNKATVFVDYAHHPSEIAASLQTAKTLKPKRIITVFQPHTFSRTKRLMNEFVDVLSDAENLYIFKEYAAREDSNAGTSAFGLYSAIKNVRDKNLYYYDSTLSLAKKLTNELKQGDILIILGAGDIVNLADLIVEQDKL